MASKNKFKGVVSKSVPKKENKSKALSQNSSKITIIEELKSFIRKPSEVEYQQLEENILTDGVRDPLVIWKKGNDQVLIDGHNRYSIIQKHNIPPSDYKVEYLDFNSLESVKDWMINNQLGRRNLTDQERMFFIGLRYNRTKSQQGGDHRSNGKVFRLVNNANELANEHNVTDRTVRNASKFAEGIEKLSKLNPLFKDQILSGKVKIAKGNIQKISEIEIPKGLKGISEIQKYLKELKRDVLKKEKDQILEAKKKEIIEFVKKVNSGTDQNLINEMADKLKQIKRA